MNAFPARARRPGRFPIPLLFVLLPLLGPAASAGGSPFRILPERARYLLGEPVYVRMEAASGRASSLEEGVLALIIRDPAGAEHAYRPPLRFRTQAAPGASGNEALPAGAPEAGRFRYARLIAEGGGWVFPRAGRYLLRLRAPAGANGAGGLSREAEALSDTVSLEIASPSAPEDRRAFAILSRAPAEYALAAYLEGGDQLREGMAVMRGLAAFPNAYANAAAFVLCSDWAQDYWGRGDGSPRRLDLAKALAYARWDKRAGAYLALRTAFRIRNAIALQAARDPHDPALGPARARERAFEDSLTAAERAWLASF